jgi:NAD(P)-dependent dehydrogenase (short-subunit alcohol dehydrogenase family)
VIQISSTSASRGTSIQTSLYGASKAGIEGLLRHIAIEVAKDGVTLNALALGAMSGVDRVENDSTRSIFAQVPVGRGGTPDEIAVAVVWLASDAGEWVTGQTIHLRECCVSE